MLEILLLVFICKKLGAMLRAKGRTPLALQIMAVFFWFGGEIGGAIVGTVVAAIQQRPVAEFDISIYLFAIGGAVSGTAFTFLIAYLIPPSQEHLARMYAPIPQESDFSPPQSSSNPYNPYDSGPGQR